MPGRPARLLGAPVAVWSAPVSLPTYLPDPPDRYPAYLSRRVYQGSSGRVYPLPFHDRIAEASREQEWTGLHLENDYLRVLVLPQLGGRIHLAIDRRTGYPLFFANPAIKPALVGLAGPWLAGGVEFNWPQHHRPATFLPVAWELDEKTGTVWCSDHDPFARMKGMHGIRLRPDSTLIELRVRLFNRSDQPQTFLWWANVAAEYHDDYQAFFPDDVHAVADHAKRAVTSFPASDGSYYGIDYPSRRDLSTRADSLLEVPGDRLDWPRNIPVPTSYMALGSTGDHFGGYDHRADAGFVHWADHHYSVGKKLWTWGDAGFGHSWNRNLADNGSTYIELMAGVFTDNQPDFSHLAPGETKAFSQYWYPVSGTGPVTSATRDVALGIAVGGNRTTVRLDATRDLGRVTLIARDRSGTVISRTTFALSPDQRARCDLPTAEPVQLELSNPEGRLLAWSAPRTNPPATAVRPASEPPPPAEVASVEELYLIGRHLEQYRHATRSPEPYWEEALSRDPGHSATLTALAARRYRDARYDEAETLLRRAIARLTALNPNPETGEAHYLLGLVLVRLGRDEEAYVAFAKATWVGSWLATGSLQLALIDARAGRDELALERVSVAVRTNPEHLQARALTVTLLRRLGRNWEADELLAGSLELDPLDLWTRWLAGSLATGQGQAEAQLLLDLGIELLRSGDPDAAEVFEAAHAADAHRPLGQTACGILADYHRAVALDRLGRARDAAAARSRARSADRTWSFPSRLDDVDALAAALLADPRDPTAAALLGHWYYAHDRPADARRHWRLSVEVDPADPVVWRNLAMAAYNVAGDPAGAAAAYDRAIALAPGDARLVFERDQLSRRSGVPLTDRLAALEARPELITQRDDLCVEYCQLLVSTGRPQDALDVLVGRVFQPWEGGEGLVLKAWERTHLALAEAAPPEQARSLLALALGVPASLGEARHPLASPAPLLLALGEAEAAAGHPEAARSAWLQAAESTYDFRDMSPSRFSDNSYFAILAARRLGLDEHADRLTEGLAAFAEALAVTPARIDYFATSLPTLLLFEDDPQRRRDQTVMLLRAELALLREDQPAAAAGLDAVLTADPSHELALDLRRSLSRFERSLA